ncbi:MAG: hypothetical protein J6T25_01560 [Bacilli bacterium]|nr:hypothetical protein [Bacilli bacterium]
MKEKSCFKYNLIKLVVYAILAVLIFVFRDNLVAHNGLKYFIGGLMLLYAMEEILFIVLHHVHHLFHEDKVYLGFIELILGIVLLTVNFSYESVCVIWATWSILRESYEIKEIACELKNIVPKIISGVESIVVIVFSILLLIEPGHHHALIHLYLLLAELVITPLTPLLDELLEKKK